MNQTDTFNNFRRNARITSVELADFIGCSRSFMLKVETGHEPVKSWMFQAVENKLKAGA